MCPNFYPCPLCYGCRNYRHDDLMCEECRKENKKFNTCNISLHKQDILSRMITPNKYSIDEGDFY